MVANISRFCKRSQVEGRHSQPARRRTGLAEARAWGRVGGRPRALDTKKAALAVLLSDEGEKVADIAKTLGVSVPTVYHYIAAAK